MANYANLLATIAANIYTNGNNEVTAAMVKNAVNQMVASLGAGYQFIDVATPATNPGTPDYRGFYIATEPGTYTNFLDSSNNPLVVNFGETAILAFDTAWSKKAYIDKGLLSLNAMGTPAYMVNGYVNTNGDIIPAGTGEYRTIIARIDPNKEYKFFNHYSGGGGNNFYYNFFDESLTKLAATYYSCGVGDEWHDITAIPAGSAYIAMTIEFSGYSEANAYTKFSLVEKTKYFEYLENITESMAESSFDTYPFISSGQNKRVTSISLLNKAMSYVTALGTTGRYFYAYVNTTLKNIAFMTSPDYKTIILHVEPGKKYKSFVYWDFQQTSASVISDGILGFCGAYIFLDSDFAPIQSSLSLAHEHNGWVDIEAPAGAAYLAVCVEFDGYGDYSKCCVIEETEFVKLSAIINEEVGVENIINLDFMVYNGYVTSPHLPAPVNLAGPEYKVAIIPVTPGDTYIYEVGQEQSAYCLSLACFASLDFASKISSLSLSYGKNEILVPSGASYLCLTLSFGSTPYDTAKVYKRGGIAHRLTDLEEIVSGEATLKNADRVLVKKNGLDLYIATEWDKDYYLVQPMVAHRDMGVSDGPSDANFGAIRKVLKGADLSSPGVSLKSAGDDICPAQINYSYIAGNHGWDFPRIVTSTAHGKTIADVGAEYTDSGNNDVKFYILRVLDADRLLIISENLAVDGLYSFANPVGPLVYSGNGDDQGNITVESYESVGNFYGSCTEAKYSLFGDGGRIEKNGLYDLKDFTLVEEYDILDLPSVVAALYDNRPVAGYAEQPVFQNLAGVEKLAHRSISYKFLPNGVCLVGTSMYAYKKFKLNFDGVVQSMNGGNKMYVPKLKPYTHDGITYDFANIENWTSFYGATFPSSSWEDPDNAPDRAVNISTSNAFAMMLGYILDRGAETNRKTIVANSALYLAASLKMYPMAIADGRILTAGDSYGVLAYRAPVNTADNPAGRTNYASVNVNGEVFIFADYHGTLLDFLPIRDEWVGKKMAIVEKTANVELVNNDGIVCGSIGINSTATASNYGYIVLKLYD